MTALGKSTASINNKSPGRHVMSEALCQGCCRLHLVCDLIPDPNDPPGLCPSCRGQTCNCWGCLGSVAALKRGDWAHAGLQPHAAARAVSWTPDGGLAMGRLDP
jgi:hypothetical protein